METSANLKIKPMGIIAHMAFNSVPLIGLIIGIIG